MKDVEFNFLVQLGSWLLKLILALLWTEGTCCCTWWMKFLVYNSVVTWRIICLIIDCFLLLLLLFVVSWMGRQYVVPNCWYSFNRLHNVITQKFTPHYICEIGMSHHVSMRMRHTCVILRPRAIGQQTCCSWSEGHWSWSNIQTWNFELIIHRQFRKYLWCLSRLGPIWFA